MAIELATAAGQVRLLIADLNEDDFVLGDDHVAGYLSLHGVEATTVGAPGPAVKRAAADALSAIATSEVLIAKVIRTQDLQTDGPKVAAELRAQAAVLRAQADIEAAAAADEEFGGFVDVVEFAPHPTGWW